MYRLTELATALRLKCDYFSRSAGTTFHALIAVVRGSDLAMTNASDLFRRLMRGMAAETLHDQCDRQLVARALAGRDEAALQAIVHRHGPMVYRVCWRVLQHQQDAEDAFQATFLILAQKLRTVRKQPSLASWLHGVARRVALKAKVQAAGRRRREHDVSRQIGRAHV